MFDALLETMDLSEILKSDGREGGQVMHRRTLCDFRKRNATGLAKLFSSTVQKADAEGLLHPDGIFALDGTKFSADASKAKTRTKAEWKAIRTCKQMSAST